MKLPSRLSLLITALVLPPWGAIAQPASPAQKSPSVPASVAGQGDRVAVLGFLDKRLGTHTEKSLRPGENFAFGRLTGTLQTCESTAPWERAQEQGAFVQIVETPRPTTRTGDTKARQIFSGWLFAKSVSLNPLQHPVYDVWLKSCTMSFPETPDEVAPSGNRTSTG